MVQKVVCYGSINLLSYGSAQESILRIESANIANELIKSIPQRWVWKIVDSLTYPAMKAAVSFIN